jgi:hypothetical protein
MAERAPHTAQKARETQTASPIISDLQDRSDHVAQFDDSLT